MIRLPALDIPAAVDEYLTFMALEANRSPQTVAGYRAELLRFVRFLASREHSMAVADVSRQDLRAWQRHLAARLQNSASRARALTPIRSWLRWLAKERLAPEDLAPFVTLPKVGQRLPRPMDPEERARLLRWTALPSRTPRERRDRALVLFLISTGCRISEALRLDRSAIPRQATQLVVMGKGAKERIVTSLTTLRQPSRSTSRERCDSEPALFISCDRVRPGLHAGQSESRDGRRLTSHGARYALRELRRKLVVHSLTSPRVLRHTAATGLLEVSSGDVRLSRRSSATPT